jgi:hypothetical protein
VTGVDLAVERAGGRRAFAEALGVTVQAASQWAIRGWVPPGRAMQIERLYDVDRAYLVKPDLVALVSLTSA